MHTRCLEGVWHDWQRPPDEIAPSMPAEFKGAPPPSKPPHSFRRHASNLSPCHSSHGLRRQNTLDSMSIHMITATVEKLSPRMGDTALCRPEQSRMRDPTLTARREFVLTSDKALCAFRGSSQSAPISLSHHAISGALAHNSTIFYPHQNSSRVSLITCMI